MRHIAWIFLHRPKLVHLTSFLAVGVRALGFFSICIIYLAKPSYAANLIITPKVQEEFEFDTNPLLHTEGAEALFGEVTKPELTLSDSTPTTSVSFDTQLDLSRFNLANFSSSDVHSNLQARETGTAGFIQITGYFDYDTTRTSELLSSGLNVAGIRHTGAYLSPEIGLQIFPLDLLTIQGGYQYTSYSNTRRFNNYQFLQLNPSLTHVIDQNNTASATIQTSYYDTISGVFGESESIGPGIGWQHKFGQTVSASGTAGFYYINFRELQIENNKEDYFFNFNLSYTGLSDTLTLALIRDVIPEATTLQVTATSLSFQENHDFTSRLRGTASVTYKDNDVSFSALGQQQTFLELNANLKYNFTQTLAVSANYRFRQQTSIGDQGSANSNAILVSLIYSPYQLLLGR